MLLFEVFFRKREFLSGNVTYTICKLVNEKILCEPIHRIKTSNMSYRTFSYCLVRYYQVDEVMISTVNKQCLI